MEEQLLAYFNSLDDAQKQSLLSTFQNTTQSVGGGPGGQTAPAPWDQAAAYERQNTPGIGFQDYTGAIDPNTSTNPNHVRYPEGIINDKGPGSNPNSSAGLINPKFQDDRGNPLTDHRLSGELNQMKENWPESQGLKTTGTFDPRSEIGERTDIEQGKKPSLKNLSSEDIGTAGAAVGAIGDITAGGQGQNQGWAADANTTIQSGGDIVGGMGNTFASTLQSTGNIWAAGGAALIKGTSDVIGKQSDMKIKARGTEQVRYQDEMAAEEMSPYADRHSVYYQGSDLDYYG